MWGAITIVLASLIAAVSGFLFPSNGACCPPCAPPPICTPPPPPTCAPPPPCVPAPEPCCNTGCGSGCKNMKKLSVKKNRSKRDTSQLTPSTPANRTRRDLDEDVVRIDAKCNSNQLRDIIIQNIDRVTAVAKKRIQAAAEAELNGRYNVICARGDFSYITNTEEYCQQTVGDVTCYVFKQLSDVVRKA